MNKKAILCIDDEQTILLSLKSQLKKRFSNNYILEFAEDADEGLEVIDEIVEDGAKLVVIVSDWLMPGMKGDEFLIKVHEKYPKIVKILLSGQVNEEAITNAKKNANLFSYIKKPWNENNLFETITNGLEKV